VVPQIGVSRFRIDLGVVHPDRPGDYLLGVECDGATYHSAATARDRDKVRAAILGNLGWILLRVWSTDWWVDKEGAAERIHTEIAKALERSRAAAVTERSGIDGAGGGCAPATPDLDPRDARGSEINVTAVATVGPPGILESVPIS